MVATDIMTTSVVTVAPDTSVFDIARLLLTHRISAVPVVDADARLVGIVSEGDLMRRPETATQEPRSWWLSLLGGPEDAAREYVKTHGRRAADVMTRPVITVAEDTAVVAIARVLEERRIKRVPVVRDGRVVGIVSRADLLRGLASRTPTEAVRSVDDQTIRERVLEALRVSEVVPLAGVNVVAVDGVVHLWGCVDTDDQRRACQLAAETVPGVRAVDNHLTRVPPYLRTA